MEKEAQTVQVKEATAFIIDNIYYSLPYSIFIYDGISIDLKYIAN